MKTWSTVKQNIKSLTYEEKAELESMADTISKKIISNSSFRIRIGGEFCMKTMKKVCKDCGWEFVITPKEQKKFLDKGYNMPERCEDCRDKRRKTIFVTCRTCGEVFGMSEKDVEHLDSRGYKMPKSCPGCRKKRRDVKVEKWKKNFAKKFQEVN